MQSNKYTMPYITGIEKLDIDDEQTPRNEKFKRWKIGSAGSIRTATGGKTWLLDIIRGLHIIDGHVYMHSGAMTNGLGARKTDILKRWDLDPMHSDSQNVLEDAILCGAPITTDDWLTVRGDHDK